MCESSRNGELVQCSSRPARAAFISEEEVAASVNTSTAVILPPGKIARKDGSTGAGSSPRTTRQSVQ